MQARHAGRLIIVRVDLPSGLQMSVVSTYGWAGASDRGVLPDRTSALLNAVRLEARCRRGTPVVIAMDLNGDIQDFD